jgi:ribosomal protein L12E/L44/L45/RPP1/RPP2
MHQLTKVRRPEAFELGVAALLERSLQEALERGANVPVTAIALPADKKKEFATNNIEDKLHALQAW